MNKTVFVLGAGASKEAGAPLMNEFLDVAENLHWSGKAGEATKDFELVFEALSHLQETQSKFGLPFSNVEDAFAAFEMADIVGRLGGMDPKKIKLLPSAMKRLISRTLELTVAFPVDRGRPLAPGAYPQLVELIKHIHPDCPSERSCIITFNYDIALDWALRYNQIVIDYCLSEARSSGELRLMKLHGSLNWKSCRECDFLEPWDLSNYLSKRRPDHITGDVPLEVASAISNLKHKCPEPPEKPEQPLEPFLVPPTWNKTMYKSRLASVWAAAATQLSEATEILVMGYSLPKTDVFFKHLLALGTASRTRINKFWVFDPYEGVEVEARFKELLGPAAKDRFQFHRMRFRQAVPYLKEKLERTPRIM